MSTTRDSLAPRLEAELGRGAVETNPRVLAAYTVDGLPPSIRCAPANSEQLSAALRMCSEAAAAVIPLGGGTAMALGNVPRRFDVVLSLEKLNRLVEHDDANLSATVEAGMTIASLQAGLAERRQFLPLDPPLPERASAGGTAAANLSGFRRAFYGSVRDRVIGMKMTLGEGERVKAGGKVMKNVAGYDMCKLFVGSLGSLGIITEMTFKLAPRPEKEATLVARGTIGAVRRLAGKLFESQLTPAAIVILRAGAVSNDSKSTSDFLVAARMEGFEESVARHAKDARDMAGGTMDCETLDGVTHRRLWEEIRDFGKANGGSILYRVTVPMTAVGSVLETVESWSGRERGARVMADVPSGTLYLALEATASAAARFQELRALASACGGHAVMMAAPHALKKDTDIWGTAPAALDLMREIKLQLDPKGILNPGRFLAGL